MPRRKFSMIKSRYRQTTPNVAFKQGKTGPYPNPPSLIGWRKQLDCSCDNLKWIETFKNNCCQPVIKKIQNKNGNVDGTYSYTTGGYLQKRYRSYDQNAFNFSENDTLNNHPTSTYYILGELKDCSGINHWLMPHSTNPIHAAIATYKKSNPAFKKQGAVSSRTRLNRLKYNTIVGSMSDEKIYFGGQPPHPTIVKSKNKCFCGWGDLGPCHGQNIKCCTTYCQQQVTLLVDAPAPPPPPGTIISMAPPLAPDAIGIVLSATATSGPPFFYNVIIRLYDCSVFLISGESVLLSDPLLPHPFHVDSAGPVTEGCGPPL